MIHNLSCGAALVKHALKLSAANHQVSTCTYLEYSNGGHVRKFTLHTSTYVCKALPTSLSFFSCSIPVVRATFVRAIANCLGHPGLCSQLWVSVFPNPRPSNDLRSNQE